jgi:hypothetical protein
MKEESQHDQDLLEINPFPKPIFVIRIPAYSLPTTFSVTVDSIKKELPEKLKKEYHILIVKDEHIISSQFEMFSVNNASVVDFEELKLAISKNFEGKTGALENSLGEGTCLGGFVE